MSMLSRVAEHLYWMARYVERAENVARVVMVNANLLLDLPKGVAPGWGPLVWIVGATEPFEARYKSYGERQVVKFLLGDEDNPSSIVSSLRGARENARAIRDIMPREAWEQINSIYLGARQQLTEGLTKRGRHGYLRQVIQGSQGLAGLLGGTMNHDQGYYFLRVGRALERADMTTRLIDVRSADLLPTESELRPFETIQWVSVLRSLTAYQMYRRSRQVRVTRPEVLRFLFRSDEFPRAVSYCMNAVESSITTLPRNEDALRVIGRIRRQLQEAEIGSLQQDDLHAFVDDLQLSFGELHGEIARTWFLPEVVAEQAQTQTA